MSIKLGETIYFGFVTSRADTGAIADATGTPAVAVYENGGAAVSGASVTKRAATTGQYVVEVVATEARSPRSWCGPRARMTSPLPPR